MTAQSYRVSEVVSPKRRLVIDRIPGGGLAGGWYQVTIDRGPPIPALSAQVNLRDLIRLRDDLSKEIDRAATTGT